MQVLPEQPADIEPPPLSVMEQVAILIFDTFQNSLAGVPLRTSFGFASKCPEREIDEPLPPVPKPALNTGGGFTHALCPFTQYEGIEHEVGEVVTHEESV